MHNTNSFNSFPTNILKLKNYVNKNYQGDNKNEILLVITGILKKLKITQ